MPFLNPNIEVTDREMQALVDFSKDQGKSVEQVIADETHRLAVRIIANGYGDTE